MSNKIKFTDQQKARLFDQLFERQVLRLRVGPREIDCKMVDRTYIEHGQTKDMLVVEG